MLDYDMLKTYVQNEVGENRVIYGYARVSTDGQAQNGNSLEGQEEQLRNAGAVVIYKDSFTGTKMDRPEFNRLRKKLQPGDTLIVTKLDRIARSATDGSKMIEDLIARGVRVHVLNMGLLDNSPTGKLVLHVMLAFAEFERDMIVQRTQEGKAVARTKNGFHEGRPKKFTNDQVDHAMDLLRTGHTYKEVAEMTKISVATLVRAHKKEAAEI